MDPEILRYRTCSVATCTYKELRGSRQGAFVAGNFVCDKCYMELQELKDMSLRCRLGQLR